MDNLVITEDRAVVCQLCGMHFINNTILHKHLNKHFKIKMFPCNKCDATFSYQSTLITHGLKNHSGEIIYENDECNELLSTDTVNLLGQNVVGIKDQIQKPYKCDQCEKAFTEPNKLLRHVRSHTGEKPYTCIICGNAFTSSSSLECHTRIHTKETPYKCNQCDKAFSRSQYLKNHMQQNHPIERKYECIYCKNEFIHSDSLAYHMQSHSVEKPYNCTLCDKTFKRKKWCNEHIRRHAGVKPHQCSLCEKAFAQKKNLESHILVHTGEKPFQCTKCDKAFRGSGILKNHMKLKHTGDRPKAHSYIPFHKRYLQKCQLKENTMTHSKEANMDKIAVVYECSQCNKPFSHMSTLKIHMKKHNGITIKEKFTEVKIDSKQKSVDEKNLIKR